ncbi:MAG: hypothetical protein ACH350_00670 [Parachlamydiaceae bacterium]
MDSDEYLVPTTTNQVVDVLDEFTSFGGLVVNGQMFGTSHVEKLRSD